VDLGQEDGRGVLKSLDITFDHVGITVAEEHLEATIGWYREKLDFSVSITVPFEGATYVFMTNGDLKIELCSAGAGARDPDSPGFLDSHDVEKIHHYCVAVDDLDEVLADLASRGVQPVGGPMQVDQIGQRIAFIRDNIGNIIELTAAIYTV
jgi:catechol 2,3-dioxygenase-like lactoylglutathione lyase family enzyme